MVDGFLKKIKLLMQGEKMVARSTVPERSSSGYYLIQSKLNGLVLDVAGSNPQPGSHVVVYPANGTYGDANQQWAISENGSIRSRLNGFALEVEGSKKDYYTLVVVSPLKVGNGEPNQQWTITEHGAIVSKLNNFVLDIFGSGTAPLNPVVMAPLNETNGTPNQLWELVPIPPEALAPIPLEKQGPAGGSIAATDFEILPKNELPKSRIKTVRIHSAWAVDKLQIQYENIATNTPQTYESAAFGGPGGGYGEFSLLPGDYLTAVYGTWGREAPGYPKEDIVTLQFKSNKGLKSAVFGGSNSEKEVDSFAFEAPPGYEIVGFFGAYGGNYNVLVRLGVYLKPVIQ
ncbi:RICIN domain-containing protein [Aerosakkonema sp. BLCC-F2]